MNYLSTGVGFLPSPVGPKIFEKSHEKSSCMLTDGVMSWAKPSKPRMKTFRLCLVFSMNLGGKDLDMGYLSERSFLFAYFAFVEFDYL